jgi:hypothetical protein
MSAPADVFNITRRSKFRVNNRLLAVQKLLNLDENDSMDTYCDIGCGDGTISSAVADYIKSKVNYYADIHLPEETEGTLELTPSDSPEKTPSGTPESKTTPLHETRTPPKTTFIQIDEKNCVLKEVENDSVNLITCFMSMHHFKNLSAMIAECDRIAKSNCKLLIREHDANESVVPYLDFVHLLYLAQKNLSYEDFYAAYYSRVGLRNALEHHGWTHVDDYVQINEASRSQNVYYSLFVYTGIKAPWRDPRKVFCDHRLASGNLLRFISNLRDKTMYIKFLKKHNYTELEALQMLQCNNTDTFIQMLQKEKKL